MYRMGWDRTGQDRIGIDRQWHRKVIYHYVWRDLTCLSVWMVVRISMVNHKHSSFDSLFFLLPFLFAMYGDDYWLWMVIDNQQYLGMALVLIWPICAENSVSENVLGIMLAKSIINHPPVITINRCGINHSHMGDLWHCFTHMNHLINHPKIPIQSHQLQTLMSTLD